MSDSCHNTNDPTLWTSLLSPDARAQPFRNNKGRCLNCHGIDHSFRACAQHFLNRSGCLNPQLGQLGDNGDACRRWQQRMRSHRIRGNSDRRRNSSRQFDHNCNRNNHGGNTHEPPRNNSRNFGQVPYNQGPPNNTGNQAPSQLGGDARNTGNAPQPPTVYLPNNGTPPATSQPDEPLVHVVEPRITQTITIRMIVSREPSAREAADRPMAAPPPSQFRRQHFWEIKHELFKTDEFRPPMSVLESRGRASVRLPLLAHTTKVITPRYPPPHQGFFRTIGTHLTPPLLVQTTIVVTLR